jgi:hypothetical protein
MFLKHHHLDLKVNLVFPVGRVIKAWKVSEERPEQRVKQVIRAPKESLEGTGRTVWVSLVVSLPHPPSWATRGPSTLITFTGQSTDQRPLMVGQWVSQ